MLYNIIDNTCRASPVIVIISLIFLYLMNNDIWPVYLSLLLILGEYGNHFLLKNGFFKYLYKYYGIINRNKQLYIPVLGIYPRPMNAMDCALFIDRKNNRNKSPGMSSGHAQFIFSFVIFVICYLKKKKDNNYYLKSLILLLIAVLISLSRVYIANCHTLQQVIIGSLIGYSYGYFLFILLDKYNYIK